MIITIINICAFLCSANPASSVSPQSNYADTSNQMQPGSRGILPLLSAARSFKPSLLLDPNYRRNLLNQFGASVFTSNEPLHSRRGEFDNGYDQPYHYGARPTFGDEDRTSSTHGHQFHGNVSRDQEAHLHGDDVEEQMIKYAIEASKQEVNKGPPNKLCHSEFHILGLSPGYALLIFLPILMQDSSGAMQSQLHLEDDELAHAISLSLKVLHLLQKLCFPILDFVGSL